MSDPEVVDAVFAKQCLPTEDEAGYAIALRGGVEWDYCQEDEENPYRLDARAVLNLCESQPSIRQVWDEAWLSCCLRSGVGRDDAYRDFLSERPWE